VSHDVATPQKESYRKNPALVLIFYNKDSSTIIDGTTHTALKELKPLF
jgi:hypothetical protein